MFCIHGFPVQGKLIRVETPVKLSRGTVVREETLFYKALTQEAQARLCQFLSENLYTIADGDLLMYAAVNETKLIVECELTDDQVYTTEPRTYGYLTLYVVLA